MNDGRIPTAIWTGSFTLFGAEIKCAVLDDGQRVIEAKSLEAMFNGMERDEPLNMGELEAFSKWQGAK